MAGPPKDDSDPLAETAAAPPAVALDATATGAEPADVPRGVPKSIGRYQITATLGQGAMGVVYAAHDADLERTIALKVLRGGDTDAARARLLREARAMARLSHPAVVTVYEVGTASGVDYVAMELIDGTTLAEWMASTKPRQDEILDAFDTAGRGLAAAHAASLVHRDFKPQNVLRSKRGRVVVTDFGLARHAFDEVDSKPAPATREAGSLSSTLTATGAVLGTPAYMAPEQHDGTEVGPAADQFAYCVALWEALVGERPFLGTTLAQVRQHIARGPDPASEAKLPRRLRAILRRGLSVDPAARFPSMDALLAAARKRSVRVAIGLVVGGAAVAIASTAIVLGGSSAPTPERPAPLLGCAAPAETELGAFTSAVTRAKLGTELAPLEALGAEWLAAHRDICARPEDVEHARRVTCLRAVRVELELAVAAYVALPEPERIEADPLIIAGNPRTCTVPSPPQRVVIDDPRALPIRIATLGTKERRDRLEDPGADLPCLRVEQLMVQMHDFQELRHARAAQLLATATEAADRCKDDRVHASLAMIELASNFTKMMQEKGQARRMPAAVAKAGGDRMLSLTATMIESLSASFAHDLDTAITLMRRTIDDARALGMRGFTIQCTGYLVEWLQQRAEPGDNEESVRRLRDMLVLAKPVAWRLKLQYGLIRSLQTLGRGAEANEVAAQIVDPQQPEAGSIPVTGRVVDEAGAPVAGARVVAQANIEVYNDQFDPTAAAYASATTGPDGAFAIRAAPPESLVMASLGGRRTLPVPLAKSVELRLVKTGSVTGTLRKTGDRTGRIAIKLVTHQHDTVEYIARIAADGTWRIDHVPYGPARVLALFGDSVDEARFREVVVGEKPVAPVAFELSHAGVPIHVIIRSQFQTPISIGIAFVIRGKVQAKVLRDLRSVNLPLLRARAFTRPLHDEHPAVKNQVELGDVVTNIASVEPGEVTLCACGISGEITDKQYMSRVEKHAATFAVTCQPVTIDKPDQVIVVEVPPMKRLPEN